MGQTDALKTNEVFESAEYMSEDMLNYFKSKLQMMREQILQKEESISTSLMDEPFRLPDLVEQSANNELHHEDFLFQDHEDSIRQEIESALQRIDDGTFGYCEETGEPIGIKRLLAVPYARYNVKVQELKEQEKKRLRAF